MNATLSDRDRAYRAALGVALDAPLPRALGSAGSTARARYYGTEAGDNADSDA